MSQPNFQVRRAVIDDLPALMELWRGMGFPVAHLEKRLTEFQVATDAQGNLLGALGLTMTEHQGWIRHEAFTDFGLAEQLRALLWERINRVAANHGLHRLWTQENSPFWRQLDFQPPDADALQKLPIAWKNENEHWLTLQLRAEVAMQTLAQTGDLESLLKIERERTQGILARAEMLKKFALLLAILFAMCVTVLIVYVFKRDPEALQQFFRR